MHYEFSQADVSKQHIDQPETLYRIVSGVRSYRFDLKNYSNLSTFHKLVKLKIISLWQGQIIRIMKNLFDTVNDQEHGYLSNPNSIWICKNDLRIILIHYNEKPDYEDDFPQVKFYLQQWCSLLNQETQCEFAKISQSPRKADTRIFLEKLVSQVNQDGYHPEDKKMLWDKRSIFERDYNPIQEELKKTMRQIDDMRLNYSFRLWNPLDLISEIEWNFVHDCLYKQVVDKSYKKTTIMDMISNASSYGQEILAKINQISNIYEQEMDKAILQCNNLYQQIFRGDIIISENDTNRFKLQQWEIFELQITLCLNEKKIFENPNQLMDIDINQVIIPVFKRFILDNVIVWYKTTMLNHYIINFEPTLDVEPKQQNPE